MKLSDWGGLNKAVVATLDLRVRRVAWDQDDCMLASVGGQTGCDNLAAIVDSDAAPNVHVWVGRHESEQFPLIAFNLSKYSKLSLTQLVSNVGLGGVFG